MQADDRAGRSPTASLSRLPGTCCRYTRSARPARPRCRAGARRISANARPLAHRLSSTRSDETPAARSQRRRAAFCCPRGPLRRPEAPGPRPAATPGRPEAQWRRPAAARSPLGAPPGPSSAATCGDAAARPATPGGAPQPARGRRAGPRAAGCGSGRPGPALPRPPLRRAPPGRALPRGPSDPAACAVPLPAWRPPGPGPAASLTSLSCRSAASRSAGSMVPRRASMMVLGSMPAAAGGGGQGPGPRRAVRTWTRRLAAAAGAKGREAPKARIERPPPPPARQRRPSAARAPPPPRTALPPLRRPPLGTPPGSPPRLGTLPPATCRARSRPLAFCLRGAGPRRAEAKRTP